MNRVVITGLGFVSPAGSTIESVWRSLVEGRSAIGPVTSFSTKILKNGIAAEVKDFQAELHFDEKRLSVLDRYSQFAVVAARSALADSGIELNDELRDSTATILGVGAGGQSTIDAGYQKLYGEGSLKIHPFTIPRMMVSAAASQISIDLNLRGPTFSTATACASGTHAIGQAFHLVRSGLCPIAIAGGSEAPLTPSSLKAWEALRILSADTCRPFSKDRSGLVLGEGAAILVLETLEHAKRRSAAIYAEICGFGMSADAQDLIAPDLNGAVRAMKAALNDAKLDLSSISYVNAHGTATRANDRTETLALKTLFGIHSGSLAISSNKGVMGHCLGSAGALEAAATALTLKSQIAPPTANYREADPECDLDYIPGSARNLQIKAAISNSFAFGGLNAVLALRQFI